MVQKAGHGSLFVAKKMTLACKILAAQSYYI